MKNVSKIVLWSILFKALLFGFEIDPYPQNDSLKNVFSTNCLQMTQSQQMLKAYIMIGLNSNFDNPKESLKNAIPLYDKRIYQISNYFKQHLSSNNTQAKKAFDEALTLWEKSKQLLLQPPTHQNAITIKNNFRKMIPKLLEGSKPLADEGLELLSLTGKLCRGPLEISIDYLMKIWEIDLPDYKEDVEQIIQDFRKNLHTLSLNRLNNDKTKKLLEKSRRGFLYFEFMFNAKSRYIPSLLSRKADDNFKIIRAIKAEYEKQVQ